ncbi:hypothetical protein NQ314_019425 [Rhamnusium bicolor]|uniref:CCHC-type domain-containing protein n=1 Tax=Rhamnusium bicolor TaxID=1586634 RepID=A0AAV8WPK1_9CUCU|nr:hypothetical protein NQ314_019425 [Rhamnusium bicolor]
MTRFARAKGSKSSNERLPEQATAWSEMKQQLLEKNKEIAESKKRKEVINQRNANYKAFLEKKEEDDLKNSKWADFPGVSKPLKYKKKAGLARKNSVENNSNKSFKPDKQDSSEDEAFTQLKDEVDKMLVNKSISKIESKVEANNESDSDAPPEEESAKKEITEPVIKIKKTKKKKLLKIVVDKDDNTKECNQKDKFKKKKRKAADCEEGTKNKKRKKNEDNVTENGDAVKNKKLKKSKNSSKEIKQGEKIIKENLTEKDLKKIEKKKQKRIKQLEKKKKIKEELKMQKEAEAKNEQGIITGDNQDDGGETHNKLKINSFNKSNTNSTFSNERFNKSKNFNERKAKIRDKEKPQRRKPLLPHKMFINGKELEVDYVDGFPVKKEDAMRLKKLRKEMISKGLPRSEINASLKLERRRAEKAFANEKKKVCFHCRKSGHNLSECPELDKNQVTQTAGSGICFKCGSTEHTHFECKVVRGQEYKFAQCFICNEQGHIARQCPDNARGLYPKGGACNVCGDVTHLKKDCPKYQAQQQRQEDSLRIETFGESNPDVLEEKSGNVFGNSSNKKLNKIIKF